MTARPSDFDGRPRKTVAGIDGHETSSSFTHRGGREGRTLRSGFRCPIFRDGTAPLISRAGYTLMEMIVVVMLVALTLAVTSITFDRYQQRTRARRAAQIFAQDLTLARGAAVRGRETVVIAFDETDLSYVVRTESGAELISRYYGEDEDLVLGVIDLQMDGDTLAFNSRGVADLSGAAGSLGTALFQAGNTSYEVSFNSMGASKVDVP